MTTKNRVLTFSLTALALAAVGAAPATHPATAPKPGLATSADLGGKDRFLSFVSTDKPIYRANEKVWVRAVLLNAATHQPLPDNQTAQAQVTILGPRGETVASGNTAAQDSVVAFGWTVPESSSGGEYTFKIAYPYQGYAPSERKFDVRIYRAPRLRNQITFARDGYGTGDTVTATVHSERAEGGFPANAKVTVIARVDDNQVFTKPLTIDAKGDCTATFALPKAMERGEGTLAFAIEDGGVVETAAKTIPILLQTLDINIYPEGGDAVAGTSNRFYLEAKTPAKKPADLVGAILDSKGTKVADVKTEHEGRGRFEFIPAAGESYTLNLTQPAGITKTWKLPVAQSRGVALQSPSDIVAKGERVTLSLGGTDAVTYKVTLRRREVNVADPIEVKSPFGKSAYGRTTISFDLKPEIDGVLTATVWNDKGEPLAERLIYRQPAHQINVKVTPDQTTYTPGGKATLNILTTDEAGKPIAANVGLTVTDDTVQEMLEKRDQAPRLPVMVFLEPEVKGLADARIYLDNTNPKAALATDLLLGTQGWRRFATYHADEFMAKYGDSGKRVLAFMKPEPPPPTRAFAMDMAGGGIAVPRAAMANGAIREAAAVPPPMPAGNMAVDKAKGAIDVDNLAQGVALEHQAMKMEQQAKIALAPAAPAIMEPNAAADEMPGFAPGAGGGRGGMGARRRPGADPGALLVVREYAHELRPNWSPNDRSDFTETVYWNAGIKTDATGKASASFSLADSVTTFRVFADAFEKNGALGTSASTVQAVQPFSIELKMPLEVTAGDVIQLPVSVVNNTPDVLKNYTLQFALPQGLTRVDTTSVAKPEDLQPGARSRKTISLVVGDKIGELDLTINASADKFSDKVTRKLRVKPKGFPTQIAFGGLLDAKAPASKPVMVPNSVVPNSMETFATVYPSPMANLTDAVAALLQEPNGCFEQTSSTNYPLAMAQTYFVTHQGVDPKLAARAQELLGKGYQKLTAFECKDKGYEWFGGATPGHEALTAYGLMEFTDMKNAGLPVVDDKMIDRTRTWLISRQDGKGGFQRNAKSLDSFGGAPALTTDAYIVWALMQTGQTGLDREITAVRDASKASSDSYVLALAANICELAKDADNAKFFMNALSKKQNKEGAVDGATTSITRSGGQALAIETTALSTLAWMKEKDFMGNAQSSMKYLADSCKGGRFGSTQSTILALKAIVAFDQASAHPKAPGNVALFIDNKRFGEPVDFTADSKGPLTFKDFASNLTPGPHSVDIRMTDGSEMPFTLGINYNSITPATDKQCKLDLLTTLKDAQIAEGGITEAVVEVANNTTKDAASPVAIIGIPGGLEVRHDQLKELVKAGKVDAYEVNGREVVLYWRQIKAGAKNNLSLSLTAGVPGTYTAPASRVYEYYTDEFKQWTEGGKVTITAK